MDEEPLKWDVEWEGGRGPYSVVEQLIKGIAKIEVQRGNQEAEVRSLRDARHSLVKYFGQFLMPLNYHYNLVVTTEGRVLTASFLRRVEVELENRLEDEYPMLESIGLYFPGGNRMTAMASVVSESQFDDDSLKSVIKLHLKKLMPVLKCISVVINKSSAWKAIDQKVNEDAETTKAEKLTDDMYDFNVKESEDRMAIAISSKLGKRICNCAVKCNWSTANAIISIERPPIHMAIANAIADVMFSNCSLVGKVSIRCGKRVREFTYSTVKHSMVEFIKPHRKRQYNRLCF